MRCQGLLLTAACAALAVHAGTPVEPRGRSATIAVAGSRVIAANPDSSSLTILPATELHLGCTPQTLSVTGSRAFVACREGIVAAVDLDVDSGQAKVGATSRAGTELFGIVSDGSRVFVSDYGAAVVRVLDAPTLAHIGTIPTEPYPRGLALDGTTLYVTHLRTGRLSAIDTDSLSVTRVIPTEADANLSQSVLIAGTRAYMPQTRSNAGNPALLFDTTVFPVVSVIDLEAGANVPRERFSLDVVDMPVNMPTDAVVTSSGKLYVVHAGSDDLSVIDIAQRKKLAHIRVGSNPRGLALSADERRVYVNNALSGTISVIDTASDAVIETAVATTIPLAPEVLNGKILFHSSARTTVARDQWISCATCHFEGGTDGRTWFFRDGPRNTPPLFGVLSTMPLHWSGDLDELQDVEQTIRIVQAGSGLAHGDGICVPACDTAPRIAGVSRDLDDLARFMALLVAPRRELARTDSAQRGAALFAARGCALCHPSPLFTDRRRHDVGTATQLERKGNSFDTPSLRGLFDTAPYFHDGSAATLHDVLARHGDTADLTQAEKEDLVAFLQSLEFPGTRRRAARHRSPG